MSKELEALRKIGDLLTQTYTQNGINAIWTSKLVKDSCEYKTIKKAITEFEELKSWKNELLDTINSLVKKTQYWEEKENKTEFEKGIARGYKTMLHQLLTGIDFDEEKII